MTVGQGLVRLRANQIGKQSVFGTAVAATRRVPWKGILEYNPNRTKLDIDVGYIDPVVPQIAGAPNITWTPTGPLFYNDLSYRLDYGLMGGISAVGGGATKTRTYTLSSATADPFDYATVESGDDTSSTDGIKAFGGVIDTLEETMPDDLGVWTFSDAWIFAGASLATDRTGALTVDAAPTPVFGDDSFISMDTVYSSMGATRLVDTLHGAVIRVNNNLDKKRLANGSNSRRQYAGWARGEREIELVVTFAKSSAQASERATLATEPSPTRFFRVSTVSATSPYSYVREGAFQLVSAVDGEIGGNATVALTYRAVYDANLTYAYKAVLINTLA